MVQVEQLQERFLREDNRHRWGHLASNLAHMASAADRVEHQQAVNDLLEESQWFIEWMVPSLQDIAQQEQLVELQLRLAKWKRELPKQFVDDHWRVPFMEETRRLAEQILQQSGLLREQESA